MKITFQKMCCILILVVVLAIPDALWSQEVSAPSVGPKLAKAVMCESIQKFTPTNPAVVFSIDLGGVSCFTEFDPVVKQITIHHRWYQRENLVSVKQFTVNPPRWSSFSSVQLRDADKGPWRVEVTDENDKLIYTLQFSITD